MTNQDIYNGIKQYFVCSIAIVIGSFFLVFSYEYFWNLSYNISFLILTFIITNLLVFLGLSLLTLKALTFIK